MGELIGFAIIIGIVALVMSNWKKKIDAKERKFQYDQRQKELARGRAIKKYYQEEEELERYRRGDYSDPKNDDDDDEEEEYEYEDEEM